MRRARRRAAKPWTCPRLCSSLPVSAHGLVGAREEDVAYGCAGGPDPGAEDVRARGVHVDEAAIVGIGRLGVARRGGADGADARLAGGRVVGRVGVVIAGRDSEEDARVDERRCRAVDGCRLATTQRHVGDGAVGAAASPRVRSDEVDAGNNAGPALR